MRVSKVKKILLPEAALLLAAAFLLAGCVKGPLVNRPSESPAPNTETEENSAVVLNEWNQWTGTPNNGLGSSLQQVLSQFQDTHPGINVIDHGLEGNTYKTKIETDFMGTASDVDVFFYWAPGRVRQLLTAEAVLPLDPFITDETLHDILPGMTDNFTIDGKLYGLPMTSSVMVLFCNRKLFDSCGLDLPESWADLVSCASVFRSAGYTPLSIGAADGWVSAGFFESLIAQMSGANAVRECFADGHFSGANAGEDGGLTLSVLQKASDTVKDFRKAGLFSDDIADTTWGDALQQFEDGETAMLFDGTWSVTELAASHLDLADLAVITFPTEDGLAHDLVGGASDSFFVNSHTSHPEEAAALAAALARSIGENAPSGGTGVSAWTTASVSDDPDISRIYASIQEMSDGVEQVPAWNTLEGTSEFITRHTSYAQALLCKDGQEDSIEDIYG